MFRLIIFSAVLFAAMTRGDAEAEPQIAVPAPPTIRTGLTGTDAYVAVPDGIDLTHASPATLAAYGFPPRPDKARAPQAFESWRQAVTDVQRIMPALSPTAIFHYPLQGSVTGNTQAGDATSSNWSGLVAAAPAFNFGQQSLTNIYGDWLVPVAQPAFNGCFKHQNGNDVYSSTWVGIDGSGSADVLQAGTESDAVCSNGVVAPYQAAWYEWYPYNEVRVTNLSVGPGAAIYVHVWAQSATRGHAYFANKTTHKAISIAFNAPPGTALIGNSAEWIVERPVVNGTLATLTNYVQEFFANAEASDALGNMYYPGLAQRVGQLPALAVQMTDDSNQVISVPTLLGQNSIWFADQGSARHLPRD